jgi:hypothetical protein
MNRSSINLLARYSYQSNIVPQDGYSPGVTPIIPANIAELARLSLFDCIFDFFQARKLKNPNVFGW